MWRWYRAPELLYGCRFYGTAADMWSVGCVFAELILRAPLFPGESEISQLSHIIAHLGNPTEQNWPVAIHSLLPSLLPPNLVVTQGCTSLPSFMEFQQSAGVPFEKTLPLASEAALDLLKNLLVFDPKKRLSAEQALKHRYFSEEPRVSTSDRMKSLLTS